MNYTQNEKIMPITEKTLVVGADIANAIHSARAFDYRGIELTKVFKFENTIKGLELFEEWIDSLVKENGKSSSIVGMEPTGHYWFNLGYFLKDEGIRLVLVNPFHVKRSKELDDNSPTKNDEFKMLHKHYTTRRENPLKKKQSLILLCCNLIRIFYALINKRVAYSPEKLLKSIRYLQLQDAA